MTALHGASRRRGLVAALLGADVLMILTGLFYGLSDAPGPKWTWYVISCGSFLAVYATLFGPLRREARARDAVRSATFRRNLPILAVLWLIYPIVDLLGTTGFQVLGVATTTAVFTVLDLAAKVGYGFIAASGSKQIADHDLAHGTAHPAQLSSKAGPSSGNRGARPGRKTR